MVRTNSPFLPVLWKGLSRLQDEMDWLFGRLGNEARQLLTPTFPLLNVYEAADAFHLEAELPGMKQEDLHVTVEHRNQVTVQGERKPEEEPNGQWLRRERGFGRFERVLTLSAPVDSDKVEAKLENGVLHVVLPKAEEAKPRRITVKAQ